MTQDKENKIEISKLDTELNPPQNEGWQISKAPQDLSVTPDANQATGTYSSGTADIINNHSEQLSELRSILIKLNIAKEI